MGGALSAALTVGGSQLASRHYARVLAERMAQTVANYVRLVTRAARAPARGYDLPHLLIRSRGLDALPLATPEIEVYAATAPLVHATAAPLPPEVLAELREAPRPIWRAGAALAPLQAPVESLVVGAVAVRAPTLEPLWPGGLAVPALLVLLPAAVRCARRLRHPDAIRALERYLLAAVLFGGAAYADARFASYEGTRRWLADTRTLVEEAERTAGPGLADLDSLAGEGEVLSRDGFRSVRGRTTTIVRLSPGRVAVLGAPPDVLQPWLLVLVAIALLGPGAAGLAIRASRVSET